MADEVIDVESSSVPTPTTALTTIPQSAQSLQVARDPKKVLKEAGEAAAALIQVISSKKKKVMMNGEQYLEFEDWQTAAAFFKLTVKVRPNSTKLIRIDMGGGKVVIGFESEAEVIDLLTNRVVSSADAMCLNDEEHWSTRTKYEYAYVLKTGGFSVADPGSDKLVWEPNPNKPGSQRPKKIRVETGVESVPLFQLRSMAQTRACAKAFRNVLSWVVVLAGFKPTPAEELQITEELNETQPADTTPDKKSTKAPAQTPAQPVQTAQPQPAPAPAATPPPQDKSGPPPKRITPGQVKRFFAIAKGNGWNDTQLHYLLKAEENITDDNLNPTLLLQGKTHYDRIIGILEAGPAEYKKVIEQKEQKGRVA